MFLHDAHLMKFWNTPLYHKNFFSKIYQSIQIHILNSSSANVTFSYNTVKSKPIKNRSKPLFSGYMLNNMPFFYCLKVGFMHLMSHLHPNFVLIYIVEAAGDDSGPALSL